MDIRIFFKQVSGSRNIPIFVKMSKIYSQSVKKSHAFVRHFSGRTFCDNAIAKIVGLIHTLEFVSRILQGEKAIFIVYSLRRPFKTPNE